jgi:hypothetical protein
VELKRLRDHSKYRLQPKSDMTYKLEIALVGIIATAVVAGVSKSRMAGPIPTDAESQVARGKYMVDVMGCTDCHTPLTMTPSGVNPIPPAFCPATRNK